MEVCWIGHQHEKGQDEDWDVGQEYDETGPPCLQQWLVYHEPEELVQAVVDLVQAERLGAYHRVLELVVLSEISMARSHLPVLADPWLVVRYHC